MPFFSLRFYEKQCIGSVFFFSSLFSLFQSQHVLNLFTLLVHVFVQLKSFSVFVIRCDMPQDGKGFWESLLITFVRSSVRIRR